MLGLICGRRKVGLETRWHVTVARRQPHQIPDIVRAAALLQVLLCQQGEITCRIGEREAAYALLGEVPVAIFGVGGTNHDRVVAFVIRMQTVNPGAGVLPLEIPSVQGAAQRTNAKSDNEGEESASHGGSGFGSDELVKEG